MSETDTLAECGCIPGSCQPKSNEGCYCWRSRCFIPIGYFSVTDFGQFGGAIDEYSLGARLAATTPGKQP